MGTRFRISTPSTREPIERQTSSVEIMSVALCELSAIPVGSTRPPPGVRLLGHRPLIPLRHNIDIGSGNAATCHERQFCDRRYVGFASRSDRMEFDSIVWRRPVTGHAEM